MVLKILILQDHLRSGGTERQSIVLTKGLLANGLDARLVTFRPGGELAGSAAALPGGPLQNPDRGWDWYSPGLAARIRETKPDFILAMGRMANCRLGWLNSGSAQKIATYRTGKPLPFLYRRALRNAVQVISNSEEAADTLTARYGIPAERITVIYNGLAFPAAPAGPNTQREQSGATAAATIFICVAMCRPEKKQRELLEILAGLPAGRDWQLWFVGDGPARIDAERRTQELGLQQRVKFLGFQPNPSALYAAADVAIHASESEALSNFLIEAQANGLPVIAYEAQGIAECVLAGETGWIIRRGDSAAFRASALRLMDAAPAEREKLRLAAVQFARDRFDADRQIASYVDLLRRLQSGASS